MDAAVRQQHGVNNRLKYCMKNTLNMDQDGQQLQNNYQIGLYLLM